jgi:hypothetical protein
MSAERAGYEALNAAKSPGKVLVQFNCVTERCTVEIEFQGNLDQSVLQATFDALSNMRSLKTNGEVKLQILFVVRTTP